MEGGFIQGQRSALKILEPITQALAASELQDTSTSNLMHPKSSMVELCDSLTVKSHVFNELQHDVHDWNEQLCQVRSDGECKFIGKVTWFSLTLCIIIEKSSAPVACNRACALVAAVLRKNPDVCRKLVELSQAVQKYKRVMELCK